MNVRELILNCEYHEGHVLLDCFFNNSYRGFCLVDFELKSSVLNYKYFSTRLSNEITLKNLNCYGLKLSNHRFKLEDLSQYENNLYMIYGVLGQDFLNPYTGLKIIDNHTVLLFS